MHVILHTQAARLAGTVTYMSEMPPCAMRPFHRNYRKTSIAVVAFLATGKKKRGGERIHLPVAVGELIVRGGTYRSRLKLRPPFHLLFRFKNQAGLWKRHKSYVQVSRLDRINHNFISASQDVQIYIYAARSLPNLVASVKQWKVLPYP
jgi:hypothetical protein